MFPLPPEASLFRPVILADGLFPDQLVPLFCQFYSFVFVLGGILLFSGLRHGPILLLPAFKRDKQNYREHFPD
jgi:hypothetical protein